MMRKILSVLLVAILTAVTAQAENKAYVSLSDTKLVNTCLLYTSDAADE